MAEKIYYKKNDLGLKKKKKKQYLLYVLGKRL